MTTHLNENRPGTSRQLTVLEQGHAGNLRHWSGLTGCVTSRVLTTEIPLCYYGMLGANNLTICWANIIVHYDIYGHCNTTCL